MENTIRIHQGGEISVGTFSLNANSWTRQPLKNAEQGASISAKDALIHLGKIADLRHLVVGIIGPRDASDAQISTAERVGFVLGGLGLTLICGGRSGVMEAASKGCAQANGLMIGILPGSSPDDANEFVGIPLPTGLGEARNMIIAKSARVLIAVGGSYGTLSEVAYGLHFSKPVIGLAGAADVEGVCHASEAEEGIELALGALLASAPIMAVSE